MIILGVDYGESKIGLAISSGKLASPLKVIKYQTQFEALIYIRGIIEENHVEKVVFGISDGKVAEDAREFAEVLEKTLHVPVAFEDETLTTQDAQRLAIEAGIKESKRKSMEDAFAAALILQNYLDGL